MAITFKTLLINFGAAVVVTLIMYLFFPNFPGWIVGLVVFAVHSAIDIIGPIIIKRIQELPEYETRVPEQWRKKADKIVKR